MDWQGWSIQGSPQSETPGSPDSLLRPKTPDFDDFPVAKKPKLDDTGSEPFDINACDQETKERECKSVEARRRSSSPFSPPSATDLNSSSEKSDPLAKTDYEPPDSPLHVPSQESATITASSSSQPSQEQTEIVDDDDEEATTQALISDHLTDKTKKELNEEQRIKMQHLVAAFSEDQLDRYEVYRRSSFPKSVIKRFMQTVTGGTISQNVVIAMSGVAKVYVGEIVEKGLDVMNQWGDTGPLRPKHIREAARRLKQENKVTLTRIKNTLFR